MADEETYISEMEFDGTVYDVRDKNIYTKDEVDALIVSLKTELGVS